MSSKKTENESGISTEAGQQFLKIFALCYERDTQPSMADSYRVAKGIAKRDGLNPELFPSYEQIRYHYKHKVDERRVLIARKGREWTEDHLANYWDKVEAGEVWIGGHHVLDFYCKVYDEQIKAWKAVRPLLSGWIDARSHHMLSWTIYAEGCCPSSVALEDVFVGGIKANGNRPPPLLYTDEGKNASLKTLFWTFKTSDGTEHSIAKELGLRQLTAIPCSSKAKTAERLFRDFGQGFAKWWGKFTAAKTEGTKEYPENLPSIHDFAGEWDCWLQKNDLPGIARALWDARPNLREPLSDEQLHRAMLRPVGEALVGRGGRLSVAGSEYQADALWPFIGQAVLVKRARLDETHAWIFKLNGEFLCEAKKVQNLPSLLTDELLLHQLRSSSCVEMKILRRRKKIVKLRLKAARLMNKAALLEAKDKEGDGKA